MKAQNRVIFLFLLLTITVKAQDKQTTFLEEVIVSPDSLRTTAQNSLLILPSSFTSREQLEQYSPADITPALNQVPGVYLLSGGMNVNRITIRGVGARTPYGSNRVRAYFDGIPVTNGVGETTIEIFDPESIGSVEIVKGPKATAHGTNLGGAMLFRSVSPPGTYLKNSFTVGSYKLLKNTLSAGHSDDKLSVNLNYEHLETDGYRENSAYRRNALLMNTSYQIDSNNTLSLLFNQIGYNAHIPSSIDRASFEENPKQAAANWRDAKGYKNSKSTLAGLSYTHRFNEQLENTTSIFYTYLDHYEPRPFNILTGFTNGYGIRSTFLRGFTFMGRKADILLGAEALRDIYNWKTIENLYGENNGQGSLEGGMLSDNKEYRNQLNLFSSIILPFNGKLTAQFGLNTNFTSYDFRDHFNAPENNTSASRRFDPILAPGLNVLYQWKENISTYINISRGFSFPGTEETLTPEGVINPELGPEKGMHYEIGLDMVFFDNSLRISGSAYFMDIRDLLVAQRVGEDEYIGQNAGKTAHKGIEIATEYYLALGPKLMAIPFVNTAMSDHRFIRFIDGENNHSGNDLTGVPDHKTNAGIRFTHQNGLFLHTNYQYIGKIPLTDANTLYTDPYGIFNCRAGYRNKMFGSILFELSGGINNITDKVYAQSVLINAVGFGNSEPRFYYPGLPRNFFGGLSLRYFF